MSPCLRYLIAFVVACHGFIFIGPGSPMRTYKEANVRSWLLGGTLTDGQREALVTGLHVIAGIVTLACAAAIAFAPWLPGWWRPLAIVGGLAGIGAFAVFWDGRTQFLFHQGGIGALISLLLVGGAILFPRAFDG